MAPAIQIDVTGAPEAGLRLGRVIGGLAELYLLLFAAAVASVPLVLALHVPAGAAGAFIFALAFWSWRTFLRPRRAERNVTAYGRTLAQMRAELAPLRAGAHRLRGVWLAANFGLALVWLATCFAVMGRSDVELAIAFGGGALFAINGVRLWSDKASFVKTAFSYAAIAAVWLFGWAIAVSAFEGSAWQGLAFIILGAAIPLWITSRIRPFTQATLKDMRARDKRAPILFIRSFEDEGRSILQSGEGPSFEAILTDALRPYGPFIGIGKPGELRPAGAARTYYSHDAWQPAVLDLMTDAAIIAALPGVTPGLDWEMNRIAEGGRMRKALFLFAPHERAERFERVRAALSGAPEGADLMRLDLRPVLAAHLSHDGRWTLITSEFVSAGEYQAAVDVAIYGLLRGAAR